jgi:hypothetical protein
MVRDAGPRRPRIRRCLHVTLGIAIVGALSLLHGWYLGWSEFIYATVVYRLTAQSSATVGLEHNLEAIGRLAAKSWNLVALASGLAFLLHVDRIAAALRLDRFAPWIGELRDELLFRDDDRARSDAAYRDLAADGRLLLRLWLIGSLAGISIGGDWWSHYLIQVVAPLSIWIAAALGSLLPALRREARMAIVTACLMFLIAPYWVLALGSTDRMAEALFDHPGYPAQAEIAAYLREHTEPGTTIYVAFDQASIYYLADRPPAYRHLYDQELRGIPSSYTDIIAIIRGDDRPEYIVATRQPGPFPDDSRAFWLEVGKYYDRETDIKGVPIYRDRASLGQ